MKDPLVYRRESILTVSRLPQTQNNHCKKYLVYCSFLITVTRCWVRTGGGGGRAMGLLFKPTFWRLTLSTPKRCHMDLWLASLVLTHHHCHRLHLLPSASSPGVRVSTFLFFYPWCYLSGGPPFTLFQSSLELLFSSPLLVNVLWV
jgi:hypothetical protein